MPSDAYPASRYGPPFDYAPWYTSARGKEVPIAPIRVPQLTVCREVEGSQVCGGQNDTGETLPWYRPLVHDYAVDAKIWKVFGVTPPSDPAPRWAPRDCGRDRQCMAAETVRRQEYETAFAAFQAPYAELDRRIRAFNADYARRMSYRFTIYEVDELVTETRTLTSDPGRILSGGAMTLAGAVTNDKSQIAVRALVVQGPDIENIGAHGRRTVALEGTSTYTKPSGSNQRRRSWETEAFKRTVSDDPMEVPVGTAGGISVPLSGKTPGATGIASPGPVLVASISLPGGIVVAPSPTRPAFPTASSSPSTTGRTRLYRRHRPALHGPAALRVQRLPVRPAAPVRRHAGSPDGQLGRRRRHAAGSRLGSWDALIPPGAKFLTPRASPSAWATAYEQKAVSDQILPPPASASWRSTATTTRSTRPCSRLAPSSRRTTASSSASR